MSLLVHPKKEWSLLSREKPRSGRWVYFTYGPEAPRDYWFEAWMSPDEISWAVLQQGGRRWENRPFSKQACYWKYKKD